MSWNDVTRLALNMGLDMISGPQRLDEQNAPFSKRPKIGLVLGGGAARGWAHIGVLRHFLKADIIPDVIAGTSIGAVVGGCYAAGKLDDLELFARSLTKRRIMSLMDFHLNGSGLLSGDRLKHLLDEHLGLLRIEDLTQKFVSIATEYRTGHEIWLTKGSLVSAVRASYALPGIFDPVKSAGRWLMDGALVNPVPVTAARALGADMVIAVNINGDVRLRGTIIPSHGDDTHNNDIEDEVVNAVIEEPRRGGFFAPVINAAGFLSNSAKKRSSGGPRLASVMMDAFNITQDRISRARLAGDPPDIMLTPRLSRIGLFEFHRAAEAIALGEEAAEKALQDIKSMMQTSL
jgi:NTE family protein